MSTQVNIRNTSGNVKHGPFTLRSEAVATAKSDPQCIIVGAFTLVKYHGKYDYVVGVKNALFPDDEVQATYQLMFSGHWRMELVK